jgi:DNA-binding NarL/FixJ family response regulator
LRVFVCDPHSIYRRGLAASLELLDDVDSVAHAGSVRDAWENPALFECDIVLVDTAMDGGREFVGAVAESAGVRVIVCTSDCSDEDVLNAVQSGAVGFLRKETLTPDSLGAAVRAAASGTGVVAPDLLASVLSNLSPDGVDSRPTHARLSERELDVLALIAAGHPTREVAEQLCYSERTVKNVLHDVVTKLNARSRSQAVAFAVREGLI